MCSALLYAVAGGVLRVLRTPVRLRRLAPRCLALGLTARALAWSYPCIGTKPLAADRAGSFPGRGHRESSSPTFAQMLGVECRAHGILKSMGGPAAGVLLHRVPEDHDILALRTWLGGTARYHDASGDADLLKGWEFFLNWPATLGDEPAEGSCLGGLKLCLIDPDAEYSGDSCFSSADWARISLALGWMPACELSVWINCNRPRDHKVLGWFSAELATRFDGMIDLDGTLALPDREDWSRFGLAGRVVEASYSIDANRSGSVHLVDPEFLRAWMFQPQFHMIK